MRARGEGTWQTLPSGKVRLVVEIDGRRIAGPARPTKPQARAALESKLATLDRAPDRLSLSTCALAKVDQARRELSPTTADLWRYCARKICADPIGALDVLDVEAEDVAAFAQRLPGAARTVRNYLSMTLQLLREHGNRIDHRIRGGRRDRVPRILTVVERECLLRHAATLDREREAMVRLALQCGLRREEIAGLKHEDRDGDGVHIRRAVVRVVGGVLEKGTKTRSSEAWVPLPPELSWIGSGVGYVIGGESYRSPSVLDDRWRAIRRRAGYEGVGLHDLRRTFAMSLLESGVDVRTASEMLRHDPKMLLDLYTASRRDLKIAASRRVSNGTHT